MKIDGFSPKGSRNTTLFDFVRDDIECGTCRYCFLNDEIQKDYVQEAFKKTQQVVSSGKYYLIILDEINMAMSLGLLSIKEVLELITKKPKHIELILTGRNAPQEIIHAADLVTEMRAEKHYYDGGIMARRGVEY